MVDVEFEGFSLEGLCRCCGTWLPFRERLRLRLKDIDTESLSL